MIKTTANTEKNTSNKGKWHTLLVRIILSTFLLILLLLGMLCSPIIQTFVAQRIAEKVSESSGFDVKIGHLSITAPLNICLNDAVVLEASDTVFSAEAIKIRLEPLPLLGGNLKNTHLFFENISLDSKDFLVGFALKTSIKNFTAILHSADFSKAALERVNNLIKIKSIEISDAVTSCSITPDQSADTTITDEGIGMLFMLDKAELRNTRFHLVEDSTDISLFAQSADLYSLKVAPDDTFYYANRLEVNIPELSYMHGNIQPSSTFDINNSQLSQIKSRIVDMRYDGSNIEVRIDSLTAKEASGLSLVHAEGQIAVLPEQIILDEFNIHTALSAFAFEATIPFKEEGELALIAASTINTNELSYFLEDSLPVKLSSDTLMLEASLNGSMKDLNLQSLELNAPKSFLLFAEGKATNINEESMNIELKWQIDSVGMKITGLSSYSKDQLVSSANLESSQGSIQAYFDYLIDDSVYNAIVNLHKFPVSSLVPSSALSEITASISGEGQGFDLFSPSTSINLKGHLGSMTLAKRNYENIELEASLNNQNYKIDLVSKDPSTQFILNSRGAIDHSNIEAKLSAELKKLDVKSYQLTEEPLDVACSISMNLSTDIKRSFNTNVEITNWKFTAENNDFAAKDLTFAFATSDSGTYSAFNAGDLRINLDGATPVDSIIKKFNDVYVEVSHQLIEDSIVDLNKARVLLPDVHFTMDIGRDNPISNILYTQGIEFDHFNSYLHADNRDGMLWRTTTTGLRKDTMRLDTIRTLLYENHLGLVLNADAVKNSYNHQLAYKTLINATLQKNTSQAVLKMLNAKGDTSLLLGIRTDKLDDMRTSFRLIPDTPIIASSPYLLNPADLFIYDDSTKQILADVKLQGPGNSSFWLYSKNELTQDSTTNINYFYPPSAFFLEANQIELADVTSSFAMLPDMEGLCSANLRYEPIDSSFMVVGQMSIDSFVYKKETVGEFIFSTVYHPISTEEHQLSMNLIHDRRDIAMLDAYYSNKDEFLDGQLAFLSLPLKILNPFVEDKAAEFEGQMNSNISLAGKIDALKLNGELKMDSASLFLPALASKYSLSNAPITVTNGVISLDEYKLYTHTGSPLVADGDISLRYGGKSEVNLSLSANDFLLIDAPQTPVSLAYGKLNIDINATAKGNLLSPEVRGQIRLLGATDLTYVMQEESLKSQNRLEGLVEFVNLADTIYRHDLRRSPMPLGGADVHFTIDIDPAVRLNADLSEGGTNKIVLQGGGNLNLSYTPVQDVYITGRYNLEEGFLRYSMPIIGFKKLDIHKGGFVNWTGDAFSPSLSITATESVRAAAQVAGIDRMVNFDAGVNLSNTTSDIDMQFVLSADEDPEMEAYLATIGAEERGKQAVGLLLTKLYLGEDNNINVSDAVTSFLTSEVSHIAGSAWNDLEVGVDVSRGTSALEQSSGANMGNLSDNRTDYSFSFAKRFVNNRVRVELGGTISSGTQSAQKTEAFVDNISAEYMLTPTGSSSLKTYYTRNYESIFEGQIGQMGVGFLIRKKSKTIWDIFKF